MMKMMTNCVDIIVVELVLVLQCRAVIKKLFFFEIGCPRGADLLKKEN